MNEKVKVRGYTAVISPTKTGFSGHVLDLPTVAATAPSRDQIIHDLEVGVELHLEVLASDGINPPEPTGRYVSPDSVFRPSPKGAIALRLPKNLHVRLLENAEREGVSLNALLVSIVSEGVTRLELGSPP